MKACYRSECENDLDLARAMVLLTLDEMSLATKRLLKVLTSVELQATTNTGEAQGESAKPTTSE